MYNSRHSISSTKITLLVETFLGYASIAPAAAQNVSITTTLIAEFARHAHQGSEVHASFVVSPHVSSAQLCSTMLLQPHAHFARQNSLIARLAQARNAYRVSVEKR